MPSPTPGEGANSPSSTPTESPHKKFAGELKDAGGANAEKSAENNTQPVQAELEQAGQMSQRQAAALLQSMKGEEARVRLDERKATRHVYNDW